jgi:hypothetical protein
LNKQGLFYFVNKEAATRGYIASEATMKVYKILLFTHRVEINLFDTMIVYYIVGTKNIGV